jgi:mttA/Hcf106 family
LGIFEILLFLVIALIVIPPDDLPQVMRAVGKVMRELRLASNTVMREISGAIGDDTPFNILPPRFDDPHPPPMPSSSPSPPPPAFLAPEMPPPPLADPPAAEPPQTPQAAATGPLTPLEHQVTPAAHQASNDPVAELTPAPFSSSASPQDATRPRATGALTLTEPRNREESQVREEPQTPPRTPGPKQASLRERSVPPADKP